MLSTLNLTKNQLSGTIPLGVCHMVCLMSLNLSYNRLKGNTVLYGIHNAENAAHD
jgi:hypothetical protein